MPFDKVMREMGEIERGADDVVLPSASSSSSPRLACVSMSHHHVTVPDPNQLSAPAAAFYTVTLTNTKDNQG